MSNINKLEKLKRLLDDGVITQEEFETQKSEIFNADKKKQDIARKCGIGIAIFFVIIICLGIIGSNTSEETGGAGNTTALQSDIPNEFAGECPVEVSAKIGDNIINIPELSCTIRNKTDKDIAAVKLYFLPKNVYGEEVNGIFATKELYTDNVIEAGASASRSWQLLDQEIKSGDLYIYSVYFEDGSEWGNKDASTGIIKKHSKKIQVSY